MERGWMLALMMLAGGMIALQAPINAGLGRSVGTLAAATISFGVGTIALVGITLAVGGGFGESGAALRLPWIYLIGGLLGAVYVASALFTVKTLGAGGVAAATITGQLVAAIVIDKVGVLGLDARPLTWERVLGVALLVVGTYLVVTK